MKIKEIKFHNKIMMSKNLKLGDGNNNNHLNQTENKLIIHEAKSSLWDLIGAKYGLNLNGGKNFSIVFEEIERLKIQITDLQKLNKTTAFAMSVNESQIGYQQMLLMTSEAQNYISEEQSDVPKNEDSIKAILDISKNVSDNDVRTFIAKTLAGEFNKPNSISRNTINILNTLDQKSIQLIQKYIGLFTFRGNALPDQFVQNMFVNLGYDFQDIFKLQDLNIVRQNILSFPYVTDNAESNFAPNIYFNEKILFTRKSIPNNAPIEINCYDLTQSGRELINFFNITEDLNFTSNMVDFLDEKGIQTTFT
jgi:hypothetical protein